MKKILLALVSVVTVLFLVACSGSQSMDGEYHEFYLENGKWVESDSHKIIIEGESGTQKVWNMETFSIDKNKKILTFDYAQYSYTYDKGTLNFDNTDYIKVGSKEYKEKLKEIEAQKKD